MNTSIFDYLSYTEFIFDVTREQGISYKSLATSARIHSSYFSRVMQAKADFSQEQLFLIAKDLKLNEEEMEYLLLLGELNSSSVKSHQNFLKKKVKAIQREKLKLLNKFTESTTELSTEDISVYYQESVTAKIHILLTIEKYRHTPGLICKKLLITDTKLNQELAKLKRLKIIEDDPKSGVRVLKNSVHLDESHPASLQNHVNWRMESINHLIKRSGNPTDYHLSALFSCDEDSKNKIKGLFKKFIVDVQRIVAESEENDDAYFLGLDLY